jgi:dTDP-4-amino-4,6-dideoxygalactose transaminase
LLDLKAQFEELRSGTYEAIQRVVDSQAFILGETVAAFERDLATYTGSRNAVGCASGTDALILALAALDVGPGDEVVTVPFTFFSTASCAYKVGARPRFVDIDPGTFNLDPQMLEDAIGPRTRAVLPVHLFGQCAELDAIVEVSNRHGLPVVEDAAQALGSSYLANGATWKPAGTVGRLGCYSFFPSKNLGGFGDGGAVVTDDDGLAERVRALRVHGGVQMYHHDWVGWNSRLDALQAAVLRVKLPHLDDWSAGRARNADRYDRLLRDSGLVDSGDVRPPVRSAASRHIFNQYTVRVRERDRLRQHLQAEGIGHAVYYPVPLHLQPCFRDLGYREGDFPRSEAACTEVVSLPVYPELGDERQDRVIEALLRFYRG